MLIDVSGRIYATGSNKSGQLGLDIVDPTNLNVLAPLPVTSFIDCAKQVACGQYHTLVMSAAGLIYSCGENSTGELGDGTRSQSNSF